MFPAVSQPDSEPLRVLVVEDEGIIAHDISRRLTKLGFEVVAIARSGQEAIERARELLPGLILMDVKLEGEIDGIEAASQILKELDVPVIYLTAHTDMETLARAKLTGPFGYLTKPLQQHSLPTTIDIALYKHKIERELRDQKAWLTTILATMTDGVAVVDVNGKVQFLNRAAEKLTGWGHEEAQARSLSTVLAGSNPESEARIERIFSQTIGQDRPRRLPRGLRVAVRNGRVFSIEGEIAPSFNGGASAGAILTFRDTTARELEEEQRRHQHKMQAVGSLAAGVAHDFNNLLLIILGYTEELSSRISDPYSQSALDEISKASQGAASLTKQLLLFSRKQRVQLKNIELNEVVRDTVQIIKRLIGPGIQLELRLSPEPAVVSSDPDQIRQVLVNLASNARDAMPQGGTLTVETLCTTPEQSVFSSENGAVILTVSDTGEGMSEQVAEQLFEPFFTTKEPGKGTGLGLSIVRTIVNDMGGVIRVKSKPGEGAAFCLSLPQARSGT